MRKFALYCIVIAAQAGILWLLYRWYAAGDAPASPPPSAAVSAVGGTPATPGGANALPPAGQFQSNPAPTNPPPKGQTAPAKTQPAGQTAPPINNVRTAPFNPPAADPNKPFDYSGAVKGDIAALPFAKECRAGVLVDIDTRKVLWDKNARESVPIASMTKMMTALLTCEDLAAKKISLSDKLQVSAACQAVKGGEIWLDKREAFTLDEMVHTFMVRSANDAAFLVAEKLGGGDVQNFVKRMNQRARELGMTKAEFHNPHGLPVLINGKRAENHATPEDMTKLAERLLHYPLMVDAASTKVYQLKRQAGKEPVTTMTSTNYLIRGNVPGVDGMKTGYTDGAGYCVTFTCFRDGHRLVGSVTGFSKRRDRTEFVKKLLDWGYKKISK